MSDFLSGLVLVFTDPTVMMWCLIGITVGTLVGALPGLGAVTGIALLLPMTFQLEPLSALLLLMCVYMGVMYGGRISAILINVPGAESAIVSTFDGYPLSRQGRAGFALSLSAIASFVGGLLGLAGLIVSVKYLAKVALAFGPMDYFSLMVFTLIAICGLTQKNPLKPLIAVFLGLLISTIGIDSVSGAQRLTFGIVQLWDGVNIAAVAVGLFGISETLMLLEGNSKVSLETNFKFSELFPKAREIVACLPAMLRGSVVGFLIGALPGTGSTIASFSAYGIEKKISKSPGKFGNGSPEGLSTSEASNNGAVGGSLIPTFALGIPGSAPCAILLGGLMMIGLQPGPLLMQNSGDLVWGAFAGIFVANILLLIMNILFVPFFAVLIQKVSPYIIPLIASLCFIGIFFIANNYFHIVMMLFFGIMGFLMRKSNFPLAPLFLGVILGPMIEKNMRQALLISKGEFSIFFTEPISLFFLMITAIVLILPLINKLISKKNKSYIG